MDSSDEDNSSMVDFLESGPQLEEDERLVTEIMMERNNQELLNEQTEPRPLAEPTQFKYYVEYSSSPILRPVPNTEFVPEGARGRKSSLNNQNFFENQPNLLDCHPDLFNDEEQNRNYVIADDRIRPLPDLLIRINDVQVPIIKKPSNYVPPSHDIRTVSRERAGSIPPWHMRMPESSYEPCAMVYSPPCRIRKTSPGDYNRAVTSRMSDVLNARIHKQKTDTLTVSREIMRRFKSMVGTEFRRPGMTSRWSLPVRPTSDDDDYESELQTIMEPEDLTCPRGVQRSRYPITEIIGPEFVSPGHALGRAVSVRPFEAERHSVQETRPHPPFQDNRPLSSYRTNLPSTSGLAQGREHRNIDPMHAFMQGNSNMLWSEEAASTRAFALDQGMVPGHDQMFYGNRPNSYWSYKSCETNNSMEDLTYDQQPNNEPQSTYTPPDYLERPNFYWPDVSEDSSQGLPQELPQNEEIMHPEFTFSDHYDRNNLTPQLDQMDQNQLFMEERRVPLWHTAEPRPGVSQHTLDPVPDEGCTEERRVFAWHTAEPRPLYEIREEGMGIKKFI